MREELLHFIWQFRYFNQRELTTETGAPLFIQYPGDANTDQGPDFKNARIILGDTMLQGPVELHLRTSDWLRHGHSGDSHYKNVILHVVWENDATLPPNGIPVLTLRERTPKLLLPRYQMFMTSKSFVSCERMLTAHTGNDTGCGSSCQWSATFRHALLLQRLAHRTKFIRTLLEENNPNWDETIFRLIARSLGQPLNADAFLAVAQSFPLSFLLRRRSDPARLERLFLQHAARLPQPLSFSRMRPAHFPTVRFRQLASILSNHSGWFSLLLESDHPAPLLRTLDVDGLGLQTKHSILINAHIPFLYAYSTLRQETAQRHKALRWLEALPPENNRIIRRWRQLGLPAANAADTQALLELKKNFCDRKRCLDCAIGRALLSQPAPANENQPSPPYPDGYYT